MVLNASRERYGDSSIASEFLGITLERLSWVSHKFNAKISQVDYESVSPFPPHSIMLAILAYDRLWRERGDERYLEAGDSLRDMLSFFSRRWLGASK